MGLDMYLNARKSMNRKLKVDRIYIEYFETLNNPDLVSEYGLYISEYSDYTEQISKVLEEMPKLRGQTGRINKIRLIESIHGSKWVVETEAGYWRKANQIHNWFVRECQDNIDDCQNTMLNQAMLAKLYNLVTDIGKDKKLAMQLLPSKSGFFFGGTEYDKWYFDDLKYTKQLLRKLLRKDSSENWQFSYQASW
jgi:hypothetical protein